MQPDSRKRIALDRLLADVDSFGQVVRRRRLVATGHSAHTIAAAVNEGRLVTAGRLWVALPDAGAHLRSAAEHGVVLTCVTAARRLGIWTVDSDVVHVAARPHASHRDVTPGTMVHWGEPLMPRDPDALVDSIENVLGLVVTCQPHERALAIWESALNKGLVDPLALGRMSLSAASRSMLAEASPLSDSGLETLFRTRLGWLKVRIIPQAWVLGHRVDFLIGDRLVVQIDGGHHVGAQRTSDIAHDAELMLRGYHVIRVGYQQIMHDWPAVQLLITQAIGQGLHRAA